MKLSAFFISTALTALLAGCAGPSAEKIIAPDGSVTVQVDCVSEQAECYATATDACGGSYRVIDSWSNAGNSLADLMPGPYTWYHMQIACGPSDGKVPEFEFRGEKYIGPTYDSN